MFSDMKYDNLAGVIKKETPTRLHCGWGSTRQWQLTKKFKLHLRSSLILKEKVNV